MPLTFEELRTKSRERCEASFHPIMAWSPTDWACAMGGECGEALNKVKKLLRLTTEGKNHPANYGLNHEELLGQIADEVADMVIYADLLMTRLGMDLGSAVRSKFNGTSEKVESPIRL